MAAGTDDKMKSKKSKLAQTIYGKEVIVQFISYLRGEVKFNNLQDLIDQMKVDEEQALAILANAQ